MSAPRRTRRIWLTFLAIAVTGVVVVPLLTGLGAGTDGPARSALVGRAAPPLHGTTLDGTPFDPGELDGHVVLVNIWASWCGPCREELPVVVEAQRRLAPAGLRVVTIDTRDGPVAAQALLEEVGATDLTAIVDPDGTLAVSWGAHGVPETFVVDRTGVIRAFHPGPISSNWIRQNVDPVVTHP